MLVNYYQTAKHPVTIITMNIWDTRYSDPGHAYGTDPNDFLRQHFTALPMGKILSLCEGEGRNAVFLADQGYDVLAVDASHVGLSNAESLAQQRNVKIKTQVADLAFYTIQPNSWDGIVLIFAHLPRPVRQRIYRQAIKGLRPAGVMLLESYGPDQLNFNTGGPKDIDLLPSLAELRNELAGLEFIIAQEIYRDVLEGKLHNGRGAVVQIVGRRSAACKADQ